MKKNTGVMIPIGPISAMMSPILTTIITGDESRNVPIIINMKIVYASTDTKFIVLPASKYFLVDAETRRIFVKIELVSPLSSLIPTKLTMWREC